MIELKLVFSLYTSIIVYIFISIRTYLLIWQLALLFFNIIYDVVLEYAINDIIQLFIKIKPSLIIYIIKIKWIGKQKILERKPCVF